MKTVEDALAVCLQEQYNFYVTAFMLETWLGELTCRIVEEIAGKKNAAKRVFQTGIARGLFDRPPGARL